MAIQTKTGQLTCIPGLKYIIFRYPKGALFLWIAPNVVELESLAVGMPSGESSMPTMSTLMSGVDGADNCTAFAKRMTRKLHVPCFVSIPEIADVSMLAKLESEACGLVSAF